MIPSTDGTLAVIEDAGSIQALTGGVGDGLTEAAIEQAIVNEALQEAALE